MRRKLHVLETELGSRVFLALLENPNGISGYDIAKKIYRGVTFNPNKIYEVLDRMKKEKLIIKTKSKDREKKFLNKLNFDGLVEVVNQNLKDKLTLEEKKEVKTLFRHLKIMFKLHKVGIGKKIDYSKKVGSSLESILMILKTFSNLYLEGSLKPLHFSFSKRKYQKVGSLMGFNAISKELTEFMNEFSNCSDSTLRKLSDLPESPLLYLPMLSAIRAVEIQSKGFESMLKNLSKKRG